MDIRYIEEIGLSTSITMLWEKYESMIREDREKIQRPLWQNMEYLYNAMKQREQQRASINT
jgi:hypothetical protein